MDLICTQLQLASWNSISGVKRGKMSMRTLAYYFGKKSNDPVDAEGGGPSPKSSRH